MILLYLHTKNRKKNLEKTQSRLTIGLFCSFPAIFLTYLLLEYDQFNRVRFSRMLQ